MKYITKGEPTLGSLDYKVDLTDGNVKILTRVPGEVGDIVLYDKNAAKIICISKDNDLSQYSIDNYTPIGVVAIPASHDVYGDGSCGVMSLVNMNTDTPDTGSTQTDIMYWGGEGVDIDTLPNLTRAPYVGRCNAPGDEISTIVGQNNSNVFLPSDDFKNDDGAIQCPHDLNAYYHYNDLDVYAGPSPYFTDGSRNPAYYQTSVPSSTLNFLSDFNGKENSQILWNLSTSQSDWKTASTITNSSDEGYYPAACCCWRFHTEGTKQGDWYLPACGELGYVLARRKIIDETIQLLRDTYNSSIAKLLFSDYYHWSSSENHTNFACTIDFETGSSNEEAKSYNNSCRAFYRMLIKT